LKTSNKTSFGIVKASTSICRRRHSHRRSRRLLHRRRRLRHGLRRRRLLQGRLRLRFRRRRLLQSCEGKGEAASIASPFGHFGILRGSAHALHWNFLTSSRQGDRCGILEHNRLCTRLFHKCEGVVGVIGWTPSFASCGVAALIEENAHMVSVFSS
jgi:hypothetical protein